MCYEDAIKGNPSEHFSVARPTQRNVFFEDLSEMSFEEMKKKYAAEVSFPRKIVRKLKRVIKRIGGQHLNAKKVYGVLYTFQR